MKVLGLALGVALLAGCSTLPKAQSDLKLAITIDDLPVHSEPPPGETSASVATTMIGALREANVLDPHGFINGAWTERDPATLQILQDWRSAGLPLANHSWSHRHLNEMTLEEFEQEVARNEPLLKQLSRSDEWRWFRYPFLDEGETAAKRAGARAVLARRGYKVAAVTMDFSDWQWPAAYARCVLSGDRAAIAELERHFLDSARENVRYSRSLSRSLYGRDIPYVLLLHVSPMTARMMPRLVELYRSEGFRFVSLAEAQVDPSYSDQMNPGLPPEPQGLEGKAAAKGIPLPPRTDYAATLGDMCKIPAASGR